MLKLTLRGLAARKLRAALSALAIVLGVGMIAATFLVTDRIFAAFDQIFAKANAGTDVVLTRQTAFHVQGNGVPTLPESLLAKVRAVPGVASAAGVVGSEGYSIVAGGKYYAAVGGAPDLVFSTPPAPFNSNTLVAGAFPVANGQIALDAPLADRARVSVGQRIGLQTAGGVEPVTVSGIFRFAGGSIGGATIKLVTLHDAQAWFGRPGQVTLIDVAARPGVGARLLRDRIAAVMAPTVKVQTGAQNAQEQAGRINDALGSFLRPTLLVFGGIAVLVAIFTIFNIFSITVAQRTRELAMLRTLGAAKGQLVRSILLEALLIGVVASAVGLAAGFGLAVAIGRLFDAIGFGLPAAAFELRPRTVAVGLAVGIGATLLAALVPALRATRVAPVAALREGTAIPPGRLARLTPYVAGLATAAGGLLLANGLIISNGSTQARLGQAAAGAVIVFVGVGTFARYLVRPLARLLGAPIEAVSRVAGRLARDNTTRNPARTAATAASLMIGVALVVFVAVFAAGLKESFIGSLDRIVRSDLIVTSEGSQSGASLPPSITAAVRSVPGVGEVAPVDFSQVRVAGGSTFVNAIDAGAGAIFHFQWEPGSSDALLGRLGPDTAIIERGWASDHKLKVGDTFTVVGPTSRVRLRAIGEYRDPILFNGFTVGTAAYRRLYPTPQLNVVPVRVAPGADVATVRAAVEALTKARYPAARVETNEQFKSRLGDQINQLLSLFYILLAVSVVISLFGIVTTLVLAVFERTREIGMTRAIGATRRQVRGIVYWESVITAAIGGIVGIALGLVFGYLVVKALEGQGLQFAVPGATLVAVLVAAGVAGVLAALYPARRAARLNVLEAIHYE